MIRSSSPGSAARISSLSRACSSGRNAHIRSSTVIYVIKNNDRKKLSETCTNPEVSEIFGTEILLYVQMFFETLSMLSMRIQLFNSVKQLMHTLLFLFVCLFCVFYIFFSLLCAVVKYIKLLLKLNNYKSS